jgi:hypothetical protein
LPEVTTPLFDRVNPISPLQEFNQWIRRINGT